MKKRLESAKRLMHLQDQKVRLVETELVRLRRDLESLDQEEARLHGQIEGTIPGQAGIFDLLCRRLDQLTRRRTEKQAEVTIAMRKLTDEKIRGEAADRLKDDMQTLVQSDEDRRDLLEMVERVARKTGSSFR
jgi:CCR4-NOT transcriptional regulation complex NOT5 subunit